MSSAADCEARYSREGYTGVLVLMFVCSSVYVRVFVRVCYLIRSFNVTALAVHLFDSTYSGVLHPLDFTIRPMQEAPHVDSRERSDWPLWMANFVERLESEASDAGDVRVAGYMQGVLIVSLGGASKSHLLQFLGQKLLIFLHLFVSLWMMKTPLELKVPRL